MTTISIKIKHGIDRIETIEIHPYITVKQLKEKLTLMFNTQPSQMKIIFQERILKDINVLQDVNVKDDSIMHLVITQQIEIKQNIEQVQQPPQQQTLASFQQQPLQTLEGQQGRLLGFRGFGATGEIEGLGQIGGFGGIGGLGGMGINPQMMLQDPYLMMKLLQHPIYQASFLQMLQNPILRQQFMEIPIIAQVIQTNPQLEQIFDNRQLFQMVINSQAIQTAILGMEGFSEIGNQLILPNINTVPKQNSQNHLGVFDLQSQMGGGTEGAGGTQLTTEVAEQKYATQLYQLNEIGLTNKQLNLEALIATRGNLDAAIDIILKIIEL